MSETTGHCNYFHLNRVIQCNICFCYWIACEPLFMLYICLHTHLHCECVVCVYIFEFALFCLSGLLGPPAARNSVWLIAAAELAVEGGVLKCPDSEEPSQLSSCWTLPLLHFPHTQLQWCVFSLVWFWGGVSVSLILNVKIYIYMALLSTKINHLSFHPWGPQQVVSPWWQIITPRCCVCVCVHNNQHWQWGQGCGGMEG